MSAVEITLNEQPYDVIGVMPAQFTYAANQEELWVPIAFTAERKATHDEHYLQIFGRLKPEATQEQAPDELRANAQRLRVAFPKDAGELDFTRCRFWKILSATTLAACSRSSAPSASSC